MPKNWNVDITLLDHIPGIDKTTCMSEFADQIIKKPSRSQKTAMKYKH